MHILLYVDNFVEITSDYIYEMAQQWKKIYNKKDEKHTSYTFYLKGVTDLSALHELTKYVIKSFKIDDLKDAIKNTALLFELKGIRKTSAGGLFKIYIEKAKKEISAEYFEKLQSLNGIDYIYRIFEYIQEAERYTEK